MDGLKKCPFCGYKAEILRDHDDSTVIAKCYNTTCGAQIRVHYGNKKKHPYGTLFLKDFVSTGEMTMADREEAAVKLATKKWNGRAETRRDFCVEAYASFRMFVKRFCPDANIFLEDDLDDLYEPDDEEVK